jgi:O-antigen ligase
MEVWEGAASLLYAFPQGVGIGNFQYAIGDFAPKHRGRASHNTFIRVLSDLGIHGLVVYLLMLWLCARTLVRISRLGDLQEGVQSIKLESFGLGLALVVAVTAGFFTERSYVEGYWWLFAMVVCLERSISHELSKQRRMPSTGEADIRHRNSYQMH